MFTNKFVFKEIAEGHTQLDALLNTGPDTSKLFSFLLFGVVQCEPTVGPWPFLKAFWTLCPVRLVYYTAVS